MVLSDICRNKRLVTKEIHADMVAIVGDDAPALSKKQAAEFKRSRKSLEDDPR